MGILKKLSIISLHRVTTLLMTFYCDKKSASCIGETRTVAPLPEAEREHQVGLNRPFTCRAGTGHWRYASAILKQGNVRRVDHG